MKRIVTIFYAIAFLVMNNFPSYSQGFLHTSGTRIVDGNGTEVILRGMGLGGWMLQEGYMMQSADVANTQHAFRAKLEQLIGVAATDSFYRAWHTNHVTRRDIDSLAAWGFNSVRLPMHYNLFTLPIQDEPVPFQNTWLQEGFDQVDSLLSWCSKNQIWLILDLHAAPGGQGHDEAISDYDPSKPSLWESAENKAKTVALWHKLAERYKDEPWIGGYDLINETNWDLGDNFPLKQLYREITDSIRIVDTNHIIFIEGNWFAYDFTGLTPPWDSNMVYSFHKYWTYNDQASIQLMLAIRDTYNVPIWLGESGENSNTWFLECVRLMENHQIGWAWWPMKKIESINCPFSARKSPGYQKILDYWAGTGSQPSTQEAIDGLMRLAENLKVENCDYHPDVVDALIRQVTDNTSIPYTEHHIPGTIFTSDFDLGANGIAYYDLDVADYHLSTNNYVSWNQGWNYRNDGVDIETSDDMTYTNGYNIGWIADNEWLKYTVTIDSTAAYRITLRTAAQTADGRVRFLADNIPVTPSLVVPNSGGWQAWTNLTTDTLLLEKGIHTLKLYADHEGFNAGGMNIVSTGAAAALTFRFVYAETNTDGTQINVALSRPVASMDSQALQDLIFRVNGFITMIDSISVGANNQRMITLFPATPVEKDDQITLSFSGTSITADNGFVLASFQYKPVTNNVVMVHTIPGKIEAEDYSFAQGIGTENTSDLGSGLNIGWTDAGDYLDYNVHVLFSGTYMVTFRSAALNQSGTVSLYMISSTEKVKILTHSLPVTSGWQSWVSTTASLNLTAGDYILRLVVDKAGFNLNWMDFALVSGIRNREDPKTNIRIYPNPADDYLHITSLKAIQSVSVYSLTGKKLQEINGNYWQVTMDVRDLKPGCYLLRVKMESGNRITKRFLK
ncbi:MAG: carbohydrate-binding protein [Chlorobi bacterium]|nr:carbohydrate-binding protein [Chlorobiota bacterium]